MSKNGGMRGVELVHRLLALSMDGVVERRIKRQEEVRAARKCLSGRAVADAENVLAFSWLMYKISTVFYSSVNSVSYH